MSDKEAKRQAVRKLYTSQKGKCFYCGKQCFIYYTDAGSLPHDAATLEHLYDKFDIRREISSTLPRHIRYAMSCYECNNSRGNVRNKEMQGLQHIERLFDIRDLLTKINCYEDKNPLSHYPLSAGDHREAY